MRKLKIILLNTTIDFWNQAAYQFSHELCHMLIPKNVIDELRWLEESICETASYFFLKRISPVWKDNNIDYKDACGNLYDIQFIEYIENESYKAKNLI